jgi:hypothetical protein
VVCCELVLGTSTTSNDLISTYRQKLNHISFEDLPPKLQEAVMISCRLDIYHLQTDSLCVLQDDPCDKANETVALPSVFNCARVTILASSAESCHAGLLWDRSIPTRQESLELRCRDWNGNGGSIVVADEPGQSSSCDPVDQREWIY